MAHSLAQTRKCTSATIIRGENRRSIGPSEGAVSVSHMDGDAARGHAEVRTEVWFGIQSAGLDLK